MRLNVIEVSDFSQTQGSHSYKNCLARRKRLWDNDFGCRRLFGKEHNKHMSESLLLHINALYIEKHSHVMWGFPATKKRKKR